MTCSELELKLCDWIDGALAAEEQAACQRHAASCTNCAELASDARGVLAFLERVPAPEPPPAMVNRILAQTPGKQGVATRPGGAPWRMFSRLFEPLLQPRLVMGMAMTILSFAMLGRFAGIEARQLRPADLHPVAIWQSAEDRVHRTWYRAVKYYQSLKIVYEVQSRLQELTEPEEEQQTAESPAAPQQKQ